MELRSDTITIADRFASKWRPILVAAHNLASSTHIGTEFDESVKILDVRREGPVTTGK